MNFMAIKSQENVIVLWLIPFLKENAFTAVKGIQRSKQGTWNGYCLPIGGIRKGYLFREKLRAKGLDLGTEPPRINIWWVPHTPPSVQNTCLSMDAFLLKKAMHPLRQQFLLCSLPDMYIYQNGVFQRRQYAVLKWYCLFPGMSWPFCQSLPIHLSAK